MHELISEEAAEERVSVSQFVRESALAVAMYRRGKREADEPLEEIVDTLRRKIGT